MSGRDVKKATTIAIAAAFLLGAGIAAQASANNRGTVIGLLECNVAGGVGLLVYSSKQLDCTFTPRHGKSERYRGRIEKFGIDVGATVGGYFGWAVYSETSGQKRGALVGNYGGVTAEVTVAGGVGANILVGGNSDTITLQPVSVQAQEGLNLALGVAALTISRP